MMSHDIIAFTRICQNMKRYLVISLHILVDVKIRKDILVYEYISYMTVYSGICLFMTVYTFEIKYIPSYTMLTL